MRILKYGSTGPSVELLQLALNRAGFGPLKTDGIFGCSTMAALREFQKKYGLTVDGIAGKQTRQALLPWYTGYLNHRIVYGDTLNNLAAYYGSSVQGILTANPNIVPENLIMGRPITIPLGFDPVPEGISCSSELIDYCIRGLGARFPFLKIFQIGKSVMDKPIWCINVGRGSNRVLYNAAFHGNEWICSLVLLKFVQQLSQAYSQKSQIYGIEAEEIFDYATISIIPAVNPDGIDISTGELQSGEFYNRALEIAADYPQYPFPSGWKANIQGIDLNLQFPAAWELAKENKYADGITSPAPGDFVGTAPLTATESLAMYKYTLSFDPALIQAWHTQGQVIYWKFLDYMPENSEKIALLFQEVSGYTALDTPYQSAFAGYKDWFIQDFNRPGYTIEAGLGTNPLPVSQFSTIYEKTLGILCLGALLT